MKKFSENLIVNIENQIKEVKKNTIGDPIADSYLAINFLMEGLEKLKTFFLEYSCENENEEIDFFKEIKPQFTSKLIYYNEIRNIESNKPIASLKSVRKYYNAELKKNENFFVENREFYRYCRNASQYLDDKYYIRNKKDPQVPVDSFYWHTDKNFTTSHDFKRAQVMANENLQKYLIEASNNTKEFRNNHEKNGTILKWTGSKVGIIELIYALHTEGAFNHGACELREIVHGFEKAFNVEIGQFHRTFYEICGRKSNRTKFLNTLKENLIRRIEQSDL